MLLCTNKAQTVRYGHSISQQTTETCG